MTLSRPRDLQPRIRPAPAAAPAHQNIRRYIESRPPRGQKRSSGRHIYRQETPPGSGHPVAFPCYRQETPPESGPPCCVPVLSTGDPSGVRTTLLRSRAIDRRPLRGPDTLLRSRAIDRRPLRGPDTLLRSRAIDRRPLRGPDHPVAFPCYRQETPPGSNAGLVAVGLPFPNPL